MNSQTGVSILFGGTSHTYENNDKIYIYYTIQNSFCNGTWVEPIITGLPFKGRWGHSADMLNDTLIIYGGVINDENGESVDCNSLLCIELVDFPGKTPTSARFVLNVSVPYPTGCIIIF